MAADTQRIAQAIRSIPGLFRGPGGAVAVVKDGELVDRHVWGFADLDRRIEMTPQTMLPICSISKQMVCMTLMSVVRSTAESKARAPDTVWDDLNVELRRLLPELTEGAVGAGLTVHHLCNNQSGLRDYWAMCTLWGSKPDSQFTLTSHAPEALKRTKSCHFPPGTEYSYCNLNFHLVGRLIEIISGGSLDQLLAERLFQPAGMKTARLFPDTALLPEPCIGYECDEEHGFFPAVNRIQWEGDAGILATLEDMIAYEKYLHRTWNEPKSLYRAVAEPQTYADGSPSSYGYGLGHVNVSGTPCLTHGGALRGFRLNRIHAPTKGVSVVVMFNHEADAGGAAQSILTKILGSAEQTPSAPSDVLPSKIWKGEYFEPDTKLKISIQPDLDNNLVLKYAPHFDKLKEHRSSTGQVEARSASVKAGFQDQVLIIERPMQNRTSRAKRITKDQTSGMAQDFLGEFHSSEVDSVFHLSGQGGMLYGSFDGFLGKGPIHLVRHLGDDICALSDPRGVDATPPGDWTLVFHRDESRRVTGVTIGCWLARKVDFKRRNWKADRSFSLSYSLH